jgi:hypothetical protein
LARPRPRRRGFSTRNLSQWHYVQACPRSVRVVPSPLSAGTFAARITAGNGDTDDSCRKLQPGPSPTAFLISPPIFRAGNDRYISFSTLFPAGFRGSRTGPGRGVYGPTYGGSPPIVIPGINWTGRRGADSLDIGQYRAAEPALGTATVHEGQVRVGTSYAAVR